MSETKRRPGGHPGMRGPGVPGEKTKDFRGSLGKLIRHCKPFYPVICIAILGDLAGVIIRLIGPNKISEITNLITAGLRGEIDMPAIQKICITLIILYVVGALLSFMTGLVMTVVTQKVNRGLRDGTSHKINRLPVSYFQSTSTGDVLSRVTNDVDTISDALNNSFAVVIQTFIQPCLRRDDVHRQCRHDALNELGHGADGDCVVDAGLRADAGHHEPLAEVLRRAPAVAGRPERPY